MQLSESALHRRREQVADDLTPGELFGLLDDFEPAAPIDPDRMHKAMVRDAKDHPDGMLRNLAPKKLARMDHRLTDDELDTLTTAADRLGISRTKLVLGTALEFADAVNWVFENGVESDEGAVVMYGIEEIYRRAEYLIQQRRSKHE